MFIYKDYCTDICEAQWITLVVIQISNTHALGIIFLWASSQSDLDHLIVEVSRSSAIKHRHTVSKAPLMEGSARYLRSTKQTKKERTSVPSAGSEPTIPVI